MLQFAKQDLICAYCPGLHCGSERGIAGHYWLGRVKIKKWPEPLMVYHPTNRIPNISRNSNESISDDNYNPDIIINAVFI